MEGFEDYLRDFNETLRNYASFQTNNEDLLKGGNSLKIIECIKIKIILLSLYYLKRIMMIC